MALAEIRRHWDRVARLGCCVSGAPNPTLHHIHGGSCFEVGLRRSFGRKSSDWLVIPLAAHYHVGNLGIDVIGVVQWESLFGTQVSMLDGVCLALNENLWMKAGIDRDPWNSPRPPTVRPSTSDSDS